MLSAPARASRRAPWGWVDVALVLVSSLVFGLVFAGAVISAVRGVDGALDAQTRGAVEALSGELVFYATALSVALLVLVLRHDVDVRALGWRSVSRRWALASIPLALLGLLLAGGLGGLAQSLMPQVAATQCITVPRQYGHAAVLLLPVLCVAAPVVEQTLFSGVLYRWLRGVLPLWSAMVVSAGLFALSHVNPVLFLPLAGLGVLLTWTYERTASIWPGAIAYALFNLVGVVDILTAARC
jgi:uncharacterized protein